MQLLLAVQFPGWIFDRQPVASLRGAFPISSAAVTSCSVSGVDL